MKTTKLGAYVRAQREKRRISLRELVAGEGISHAQVNAIERGETKNPHVVTLLNLGAALEISPFKLFQLALEDQPGVTVRNVR